MPREDANSYMDFLAPFASEENKKLHEEIKNQEQHLAELNATIEDSHGRTSVMLDHMKNINQELYHSQAIYEAKVREIETEEHLKQLAERQSGRLALEITRMKKDIVAATEHLGSLQNELYRNNERVEQARQEMKMNKEQLEEWIRVENEKEEDAIALARYSKIDDNKIKELSLQIEKLLQEASKKKHILSVEVTETQVAQLELDKTTELFRELHVERQQLIQQWEQAIDTMRKRDETITEARQTLQQLKSEVSKKQAVVEQKQVFLDEQLRSNQELEKKIDLTDRYVAKYREEQQETALSLRTFQDEVEVLRNALNKGATDLMNKRSEISALRDNLQDKNTFFEKEQLRMENTKQKYANVMDNTVSLEAKSEQLQEFLHKEEQRAKELDKTLKSLKDQHFKNTQDLFHLKKEEKDVRAELIGSEASLKNWRSKIVKLDAQSLKQQELIYNQDFQIQLLERKIRRAQGERTDEEKEVLVQRINSLQEQLDVQIQKETLLMTQMKRAQEDSRLSKRHLERISKEREVLAQQVDNLNLYNDSAARQLENKIREKEEFLVEENMLHLELRRLRSFLNARADEVYSLENRQIQLQMALTERQKEISIQRDLLRVQHKNAEEERVSAKAELRERQAKVDKLRRKYEILITQFAPEEGQEEHSQAFYVIKAAQRREELQREGDALDAKIRNAEREIRALQNTLDLMNGRNESYRHSLYRVDTNSKEAKQREIIEQQMRSAMDKYKAKRNEVLELQSEVHQLDLQMRELSQTETQQQQRCDALESRITALGKELSEQDTKKQRALYHIAKIARELHKGGASNSEDLLAERDILLKQYKEYNNELLHQLGDLVEQHPQLREPIQQMYTEGPGAGGSLVLPAGRGRESPSVNKTSAPPSRQGRMSMPPVPSAVAAASPSIQTPRTSQPASRSSSVSRPSPLIVRGQQESGPGYTTVKSSTPASRSMTPRTLPPLPRQMNSAAEGSVPSIQTAQQFSMMAEGQTLKKLET